MFFPQDWKNAIDLQVEEAQILGIRMVLCRGSMDRSEKDGGLPPDSVVQTCDEILADSERLIQQYHNPEEGAMTQIALAPCSPFSVSETVMRESAKLAEKITFCYTPILLKQKMKTVFAWKQSAAVLWII